MMPRFGGTSHGPNRRKPPIFFDLMTFPYFSGFDILNNRRIMKIARTPVDVWLFCLPCEAEELQRQVNQQVQERGRLEAELARHLARCRAISSAVWLGQEAKKRFEFGVQALHFFMSVLPTQPFFGVDGWLAGYLCSHRWAVGH